MKPVTAIDTRLKPSEMDLLFIKRDAARERLDFVESKRIEDEIGRIIEEWCKTPNA